MNTYSIALFLHIVGALGFFVALGLEWTRLRQLRSATTSEQVRASMRVYKSVRRFGMASMLTILLFGFYMAAVAWGGPAWIIVALGSLVLIIVITIVLTRPRIAAIEQALAGEKGPLSPALQLLADHPLMWVSIQTRVAIALGIVFLMTVKPGWGGSLLTIGVAIVLGLVAALPLPRRERKKDQPVNDRAETRI
jgi:hypothetical protein